MQTQSQTVHCHDTERVTEIYFHVDRLGLDREDNLWNDLWHMSKPYITRLLDILRVK